MNHKRIVWFLSGILMILLIVLAGWVIRYSQERSRANELRYHVFCELIKTGMDRTEVRDRISQYGEFRETVSNLDDYMVVYIIFIDPNVYKKFGGRPIVISFENEKYIDAHIPVPFRDANKSICH